MKWIPWGKTFGDLENSFEDSVYSLPGLLIEAEGRFGGKEQYLIGDINASGGVCTCCTEVKSEAIVVRYVRVWKKE